MSNVSKAVTYLVNTNILMKWQKAQILALKCALLCLQACYKVFHIYIRLSNSL